MARACVAPTACWRRICVWMLHSTGRARFVLAWNFPGLHQLLESGAERSGERGGGLQQVAELLRHALAGFARRGALRPVELGPAVPRDRIVQGSAVCFHPARGRDRCRLREPVGAQEPDRAAPAGRHLLRLRGLPPRRDLLRGKLHPRVELRVCPAVPVPAAGARHARRRLPLQPARRRRHELPPSAPPRPRAVIFPALRRRPVRRHRQGVPGLEDIGRLRLAGPALAGREEEPRVRLVARKTATGGTATRTAYWRAGSTTPSTPSCSAPTPGSPASTWPR